MAFDEDLKAVFGESADSISPNLREMLHSLWKEGWKEGALAEKCAQVIPDKSDSGLFIHDSLLLQLPETLVPGMGLVATEWPRHLFEDTSKGSYKNESTLRNGTGYRGVSRPEDLIPKSPKTPKGKVSVDIETTSWVYDSDLMAMIEGIAARTRQPQQSFNLSMLYGVNRPPSFFGDPWLSPLSPPQSEAELEINPWLIPDKDIR